MHVDGRAVRKGLQGDSAIIGLDSNDVDPGSVTGDFVRDVVCLGMERTSGSRMDACAEVILVAATNMTAEPFLQAPFDGIIGLGLEGLSVNSEFSFFGRLTAAEGLLPQFAIFLPAREEDGLAEISFGGYNSKRLAGDIQWVPVVEAEKGFWQVSIKSVRIGDRVLDICDGAGGCRGAIDSSSSRLGVPAEALEQLEAALGVSGQPDTSFGDCTAGPNLQLVLEGGATLSLRPQDYTENIAGKCKPLLHPLAATDRAGKLYMDDTILRSGAFLRHSFVLGEPLLRRYYTVFDWEHKRIGFGLAAAVEEEMLEHTEEFILLQCQSKKGQVNQP